MRYCAEQQALELKIWPSVALVFMFSVSMVTVPDSLLAGLLMVLVCASTVPLCGRFWRRVRPLQQRLGVASPAIWAYPLLGVVATSFLIAQLVQWLLVSTIVVSGASMAPALRHGDLELLWRSAYGLPRPFGTGYLRLKRMPERGDVVSVNYRGKLLIGKRVIAVGGDTLEVHPDRVLVNNMPLVSGDAQPVLLPRFGSDRDLGLTAHSRLVPERNGKHSYWTLEEPGHAEPKEPVPAAFARRERFPCTYEAAVLRCTIPAGQIFVMGDNRTISGDSRQMGTVPVDELLGRVVLLVNWRGDGPWFSSL